MPESIRNAIVLALIAVLVAVMGVGLLLWTRRPAAAPPGRGQGLSLLVNDRDGGVYDLSVKLGQLERRLAESQVTSQRLLEQLAAASGERAQLTNRLAGLEKEVRSLRKRVQETEKRLAPVPPGNQPTATTTPLPRPAPPATTTAPPGEPPATSPP